MLEAFIDGHPDVKVDFRIGDVITRQVLMEACSILLQHVSVVLPATALCEHLQQADCELEEQDFRKDYNLKRSRKSSFVY